MSKPPTHKEQVLRLLSDNQPHSHLEGYRLGVMLHSRVADLRKDGYMVKCWYENKAWMYQLFGSVREAQGTGETAVSDGNPESHGPRLDIGGPPPVSPPESAGGCSPVASATPQPDQGGGHQLSVFEAA